MRCTYRSHFRRSSREGEVRSPSAYLSKVVTRLCIDRLRSARMRREQYVGPWLPEPVLGEQAQEIGGQADLEDSLSMAFLVSLESIRAIRLVVNPEKLPNVPPLERTEREGDSR